MPATKDLTPEQAQSFLDDVGRTTSRATLRPALERWVDELAGDLGEHMVGGTSPEGFRHRPLKRKRPPGHNQSPVPLIDTGAMLHSVLGGGGANHIEQITDNSVTYGTSDPKAAFHQFGTSRMPARPFVGISPEMEERAVELVTDHILQQIEAI